MKHRITYENREISLTEMFWFVLSKKFCLCLCIVFFICMFGVSGIFESYYHSRDKVAQSYEEMMSEFSEPRQELILSAVQLNNTYKSMNESINTNYLMMLNPDNLVKGTLQYYVDTGYTIDLSEDIGNDYTDEIIEMYVLMADGNEVINDVMGLGINNLERNDVDYLVATTVTGGVFKVVVCANEDDCQRILNVIKECIEQNHENVTEGIGEHKISLVSENYICTYSDYIRNAQTARRNQLKTYSDNLTTVKKSLTESEVEAFNKIVSNNITTETKKVGIIFIIKCFVIGAVVGFLVGAVILVIVYMFGSTIKSISEVEQIFNLNLIGKVVVNPNIFKLKRNKIFDIKNEEEQIKYIVRTIEAECNLKGIKSVALCSTQPYSVLPDDADIKKYEMKETGLYLKDTDFISKKMVFVKIFDRLLKDGIEVKWITDLSSNTEHLDNVLNVGNCILVGNLDLSERKIIEETINICDRLEINILGMIVCA